MSNLDELRKSISEISVYDMSCYSAIELCYMLGDKIKTCAEALNYLLEAGVNAEVVNQLARWKEDGTLQQLINEGTYNDIVKQVNEFKRVNLNLKPQPQLFFFGYQSYIGDCMIIKTRDGNYYMIDTGGADEYEYIKSKIDDLGIKHIKALFVTHSHDDHIGNAEHFIVDYNIEKVYLKDRNLDFSKFGGDVTNQQAFHDSMIHACINNKTEIIEFKDQEVIQLSEEEVLIPYCCNYKNYADYNYASIPLLYKYKNTNIMFLADAPKDQQQYMLDKYQLPRGCDLVKMAHHGNDDYYYKPMITALYPVNTVFNSYYPLMNVCRMACQFYEANTYHVNHYAENKGLISFIIGDSCVTTSAKQFKMTDCWAEKNIDERTIYFDQGGYPVKTRLVQYKGDYYYMDDNYNLHQEEGWIEKYPSTQTYYYYCKKDNTLACNEWIPYQKDNVVKWCYAKSNCCLAREEIIYVDGEYRRFDGNSFCGNPPANLDINMY